MADDLKKRNPQDSSRINVHEPWERRYWASALGVSENQLEELVEKYGDNASTIRSKLVK